MKETRTRHERIVGVNKETGAVEFLDTTFFHSPSFKGATGYSFEIYNKRDAEAILNESFGDSDNWRDEWTYAVQDKRTESGLKEWMEEVREEIGEDDIPNRDDSGERLFMLAFEKLTQEQKKALVDAINRAEKRTAYISDIFTPFESVMDFEENALPHCYGCGRIWGSRAEEYQELLPIDAEALEIILDAEKQEEEQNA